MLSVKKVHPQQENITSGTSQSKANKISKEDLLSFIAGMEQEITKLVNEHNNSKTEQRLISLFNELARFISPYYSTVPELRTEVLKIFATANPNNVHNSTLAHIIARHCPAATEAMLHLLGEDAVIVTHKQNNIGSTVLSLLISNHDKEYSAAALKKLGKDAKSSCLIKVTPTQTIVDRAKKAHKAHLNNILIAMGDFAELIANKNSDIELVQALGNYRLYYSTPEFSERFNPLNLTPFIAITRLIMSYYNDNRPTAVLQPLLYTVLKHIHSENEEIALLAIAKDVSELQIKTSPEQKKIQALLAQIKYHLGDEVSLQGQLKALVTYFNQDDFRRGEQHKKDRAEHFEKMIKATTLEEFEAIKNKAPTFLGIGDYKPYVSQLSYQVLQTYVERVNAAFRTIASAVELSTQEPLIRTLKFSTRENNFATNFGENKENKGTSSVAPNKEEEPVVVDQYDLDSDFENVSLSSRKSSVLVVKN